MTDINIMAGTTKPVFSSDAFLFKDSTEIDHIDKPASTYKGVIESGTWSVILSNGVKELLMAANVPDEALAKQLALAKGEYQEYLVTEGVYTGTDDVLIQDPEGSRALIYSGFEK